MGKIRVLLADDHAMFRQGIREMLSTDEEIEVVGEAGDGREALALAEKLEPDVVLLDVEMPLMGAKQTMERMLENPPPPRVVIVTMFDDPRLVRELIELGAVAYLVKSATRVGEIGSPRGPQARIASCVLRRSARPRPCNHLHVTISPVVVRNPTHHAATLGDPVALAHPHRRADMHFFRLHYAPPAPRRPSRGSVGFEDELLFGVYLGVLDVVGAGRDDLLDLIFGRLQGRVPLDQVFSHHGAQRIVVFRFQMLVAMAKHSTHPFSSFPSSQALALPHTG